MDQVLIQDKNETTYDMFPCNFCGEFFHIDELYKTYIRLDKKMEVIETCHSCDRKIEHGDNLGIEDYNCIPENIVISIPVIFGMFLVYLKCKFG